MLISIYTVPRRQRKELEDEVVYKFKQELALLSNYLYSPLEREIPPSTIARPSFRKDYYFCDNGTD
jgi:hypothetical protein